MTCALIVPVGNESSPSFTTSESVHQLIESVRADRMVVITRQGSPMRNREIDDAAVQSDVRDFLPNFLPTHGSQQIMIFAPPKEEVEGNTIASGKLESGDSFVVQDFPLEGKHFSRRLSFTSNLKATQSEMLFHVAGKKKKVFEPTVLTFSIHRCMAAALLACPPATSAPRIVVLGVGGGCLPSFFHAFFPAARITAVDIDAAVVRVAREFFRLPEAVETVVADALEYVKALAARAEAVDYLFVDITGANKIDIDAKDPGENTSFPPMPFLSVGAAVVVEV